jgi:cyclic lactone autoinducer peptide
MKKIASILKTLSVKSAETPVAMKSPPCVIYQPKMPQSLREKLHK